MNELKPNEEQIDKSIEIIEIPTVKIGSVVTFRLSDQYDESVETRRIVGKDNKRQFDDSISLMSADTFVADLLLRNNAKVGDNIVHKEGEYEVTISVISIE